MHRLQDSERASSLTVDDGEDCSRGIGESFQHFIELDWDRFTMRWIGNWLLTFAAYASQT